MHCSIEGCERRIVTRDPALCRTHYMRLRRTGRTDLITPLERLHSFIDQRPGAECWLWTGGLTKFGYGKFSFTQDGRKRTMSAHRALWLLTHGEPDGHVLHSCGNGHRACVRLDHLYDGSHAQNMRDREQSGRSVRGTGNGNHKLTEEAVLAIRNLAARRVHTQSELAIMFDISHAMVSFIVTRQNWRHI